MAQQDTRQQNESASTDTVIVACKLPSGLLMRLFKPATQSEPMMGGGYRDIKVFHEMPEKQYRLNGFSHEQNKAPTALIVEGAALTFGIPKAFWDQWYEQNKNASFIERGLIYAVKTREAAMSEAKNRAKDFSGLERIDPARAPKRITPTDEMKRRFEENKRAENAA